MPRRKPAAGGMMELPIDIDVPSGRWGFGPVYQGVCLEIRQRIDAGTIDEDLAAGAIAAARACARAVDYHTGYNARNAFAAGMQLAALHAQLAAWLVVLAGETEARDAFAELMEEINHGAAASGDPAASHAPE